jgi:hypothetical protein
LVKTNQKFIETKKTNNERPASSNKQNRGKLHKVDREGSAAVVLFPLLTILTIVSFKAHCHIPFWKEIEIYKFSSNRGYKNQ